MTKVGLDIGVASIGWCVLSEQGKELTILGMGSRVIPLDKDSKDQLYFVTTKYLIF